MIAERIKCRLAGDAAPRDRAAAAQDSLDLLAVLADLKPVALIGHGYHTGGWLDELDGLLAGRGFSVRRARPWFVDEDLADLPAWYREPIVASLSVSDILCVSRPGILWDVCGGGVPTNISLSDEAELLGYPVCCVRDHYRRRRAWHGLMIERIADAAGPSHEDRRRLAEGGVMFSPRNGREWQCLRQALHCSLAPFTSIAMCPGCDRRSDSPARVLSRRYRALARDMDVVDLFDVLPRDHSPIHAALGR